VSDPREALRSLADAVASALESVHDAATWYHQGNSPLHKTTYLRLVRAGKLNGCKVGGRILVKRAELDAYIEAHPVEVHVSPEQDEDAEAERLLRNMGVKKAS
jgi:excisionase family DNA binding protein